jgi:hypothetical protein
MAESVIGLVKMIKNDLQYILNMGDIFPNQKIVWCANPIFRN